ncbi:DEAD/DEAH box helicase [Brevundimonas sp.]|uniref:DEAD/DEAH box helicase n=1 Tax=Brevundimonas sp. TaxID=1871086 RepID=UPI0028AFDDDD|nr:DEAD/DEAH box helicase [Brevundimonas sp.]
MPFPAIHPALDRALVNKGYAEPTPVQAAVLDGHGEADMLVSAQTGSGKTVAFGLAAASTLLGDDESFGPADAPLMLAIAPTRELALQVSAELEWLYGESKAKITTCVGGMDARKEARALNYGIHIVVGTPGRLKDHIDRGNLDLSALKVLVLDEADEMLDMGFREDLEYILEQSPAERRTLLFSATIARDIAMLAKRYQRDAVRIDTVDRSQPHSDIEYRALRIAPNEIEHAVVNVLRFYEAPGALVFCSTRDSVRHLQSSLLERGFSTVALSGEMGQRERTDALQALRDGRARVCVATDVAARGLDLPDLGLVIHAELPINKATMLHRSGRTGRAGKKGTSILLVPSSRRRKAEMLLGSAGVEATWAAAPTADEILAKDEQRLLAAPIFAEEGNEDDAGLIAKLVAERTPEDLARALLVLLRKDLPAPEDLTDPGQGPQRKPREAGDAFAAGASPFERLQPDQVSWFRMDIGRNRNADPKWLIPMICRIGGITKQQIGSIKTFPEETRFEIANTHVEAFRKLAAMNTNEANITPSEAPHSGMFKGGARNRRDEGGERPYAKKPFRRDEDGEGGRPPFKKKPWQPREGEAEGERPAFKKKPYAPRADAPEGSQFFDKPYEKPFAKGPGAKKPFKPKSDFKASGKPGFKPAGKPAGAKPFNKAGKPGKRFD